MRRFYFSSPGYGGGALRSSVKGAVTCGCHSASLRAVPLRLASLASSPANGEGKLLAQR